jgi:CHAD domain-containing protein
MAHSLHIREPQPLKRIGLDDWMSRVAELAGKVQDGWDADDIHDLRTAMRRCRSMAESLSEVNPDPGWRKLKKTTRKLFRALGELRDSHVKLEWIKKLAPASDPLRKLLVQSISERMAGQQETCQNAMAKFDPKEFRRLSKKLGDRAQFFPLESVVYQRLALTRLNEAALQHQVARKGRSRIAWHRLRIALKHFRYTLENFTPQHGESWMENLKHMQDLLGDVHDLDVLRREIWRHKTKTDLAHIERWLELMQKRRARRLAGFASLVAVDPPVWQVWRSGFRSVPTLQFVPAPAAAAPAAHSAS